MSPTRDSSQTPHAPQSSGPPLPGQRRPLLSWQTVIVVVVITVTAAALTFYFTKRSFDLGDRVTGWPGRVAGKLGKLLQTTVSVSNNSFTLNQKDIAELAVVQRRILCTTKYDASWLGSAATVIVQGVYTVKAGYNFKEGCQLSFDERGHVVSVHLPNPKVLSNTTESQKVMFASEGILKKIPPQEMERVFAQNLEQANREASDLGMLDDARSHIKERLGDLLGDEATDINLAPLKQ